MRITNIEFLLSFSILCFIRLKFVENLCVIHYPDSIETTPIYTKTLSKYTLYLPYNGKALEVEEGETVQAICRTSFSPISYRPQKRGRNKFGEGVLEIPASLTLQCVDSQLYYKNFILEDSVLECTKLKWSVYDTEEKYGWCEKNENTKTFLLAVKSYEDHHILAGICFNLNNWSLETITYNVTTSNQLYDREIQRDITRTELKSFQSLGDDLWNMNTNYFALPAYELERQLEEMSKRNPWLHLATYDLSPIVQGSSYRNYFNEFGNMLNIIWWRNLRLGNWKLFMDTLENYAHNNSFQLYTGTSGVVLLPKKNATDFHVLEIENGYLNHTVPGYIWTYLVSLDNVNEDFIVFGYNSPFAQWMAQSEVVFCPSICSEIPWLKTVAEGFYYQTAGIMFCCSTEFIRQANNLPGFPMDVLLTRAAQKDAKSFEIKEGAIEGLLKFGDLERMKQNPMNIIEVQNAFNRLLNSTVLENAENQYKARESVES